MKPLFTLTIGVCALLLSACNDYTSQLCTPDIRTDVPGLEGTFKTTFSEIGKYTLKKTAVKIIRKDKGVYTTQSDDSKGTETLYTCNVGGQWLAESPHSKGGFTSVYLNPNSYGFELTLAAFDKDELDKGGIPYEIKARPMLWSSLAATHGSSSVKSLVVDNAKVSGDKLVPYLHPLSIALKLFR